MDERSHLLERLLGGRRGEMAQQTFALALEDGQVDLATRLAVLSDELLEVRAGMPIGANLGISTMATRTSTATPIEWFR